MPSKQTDTANKYQFIHHFVPHKHHKTRARLLSHTALLTYILVLVGAFSILSFLPRAYPGVLGYASNIEVAELLRQTNRVRAEHDLKPLTLNQSLSNAAYEKALDMFEDDYWAHIAPDGREPWDFILESGYDYLYAGENLAKNFNDSDDVVDAWFKSPSHRENLLGHNYDDIGFAVVNGVLDGYETTLVVQMFGRPRYQAPIPIESPSSQNSTVPAPPHEVAIVPVPEEMAEAVEEEVILIPSVPIMQFDPSRAEVLPAIDVAVAYKSISVVFILFLVVLLSIDIWYSKKHAIPKLTGNTVVHLTFLVITILGVLIAMSPGRIL